MFYPASHSLEFNSESCEWQLLVPRLLMEGINLKF